ncbi:hypothetical protein cypCar_00038583 [Cyprinus carpio]|nr:hypothetical protein cypCar_00038583 [Cyprinus carpio]
MCLTDAEMQDIVLDPVSELLPDNVFLKYLNSLESIEEDFDPKFFDNFSVDTDTTSTPIPEKASFTDEVQSRKRKVDATSDKPCSNKKAAAWPESPSNGRPPTITPESSFPLSSTPFQHVLPFPFSPTLLPPSGGSPLQFIQTIGPYTAPLIGTVVPTGTTYVIVSAVSPQCVSPGTQIIPLSPANGTVAPKELTFSELPVGSFSDSACQGLPPVSVDTLSPTKEGNAQKNYDSTPPKNERKIRPEATECVKEYIRHIKSYMRDACCSMRGGMGMESHYVDMHLVQRKLLIKSGKNANKCLEKELVVLSDSERKKAKLDRSQLFHNSDSKIKQAHTADTIGLWEDLHQSNDELNLKSAIEKFTLHPFKATQGYHIESLPVLVQIHREKKLPMSEFVSALDEGVPALRHLQRLEFELGVQNGPELFPKLIDVLPSLQSLQHLDLEKNQIGDSGAEKLAGVLHFLECLKLLNLSQNLIGDAGVEKLAKALASVPSLQSLSLYGNAIADSGAEHLALVLPDMNLLQDLDVKFNKFTDIGATKLSAALKNCTGMKSLELWNDCIPYGVFEHLRLQDPRIRSL